MSNIIPKEQLSAYQRWELNSLDGSAPKANTPTVPLPTAEEVEQIYQQATREGYAAGYQEGKAKSVAEVARLSQVMSALDATLLDFEEKISQSLLTLALEVAKQMLREALKVRPELIFPVIREAVGSLPHVNQHPHLKLHPEDAALVKSLMGDELNHFHWKVLEDDRLTRGGCRVETANSEIDATLECRWKRTLAAVCREGGWLD